MSDIDELFGIGGEEGPPVLSEAGEARRDEMLCDLTRAVARRRRRRAAQRWSAAAACFALVAIAVYLASPPGPGKVDVAWLPDGPAVEGSEETTTQESVPSVPALAHVRVEVVRDDPAILERCRVEPRSPPEDVFLGDDELLDLLARADRPAGLIRVGGRVILTGAGFDTPPGGRDPGGDG